MQTTGSRIALFGLIAVLASGSATAATTWIDCSGQMVTSKAGKEDPPAAAHDIYVVDDAAKTLYKYSDARKSTDLEPVTSFDDKQITWAEKADLGALDTNWQGHLDRTAMSLRIEYKQIPEMTVWTEQCKPTDAQPIATAIDTPAPDPASKPAAAPAAKPAAAPAAKPAAKPADKPKG